MKYFVAILALAAVIAADVSHIVSADGAAQIVKQDAEVLPDGYEFAYETSNHIAAQESGHLKNAGLENEAISVQGSNSFVGTDGQQYSITYIADENGYQPQGSHLPTPHPIPEYILRSLEYIRTRPASEIKQTQGSFPPAALAAIIG